MTNSTQILNVLSGKLTLIYDSVAGTYTIQGGGLITASDQRGENVNLTLNTTVAATIVFNDGVNQLNTSKPIQW